VENFYRIGSGRARRIFEVSLLRKVMPENIKIYADETDYRWVILQNFPLGFEFTPHNADLLIVFGNFEMEPPLFFLQEGIKLRGKSLSCTEGYHQGCSHLSGEDNNLLVQKGWALFVFEVEWNPSLHTTVHLVFRLSSVLDQLSGCSSYINYPSNPNMQ